MNLLKITLEKPRKYYRFEHEREYLRPGEPASGYAIFDPPGRRPPAEIRVAWTDSYGRVVASTPGEWNARLGRLGFNLDPAGRTVSLANFLEVRLYGRALGRERFVVTRPRSAWDEYRVFVWARYPAGYYDELRNMGVEGAIAYKRDPFDYLVDNDVYCYVDQLSNDEPSVYHRPYMEYWETPEVLTNPERDQKWFLHHWDVVRQRYKRVRARLKGASVALNKDAQKTLWRLHCLSDPAVQGRMRERIITTVAQHKMVRPLFYNLCDEPGTGDQAAPFDFCYCPHCMERFREWLEKRYGTLEALNGQWGTGFRRWRDVLPLTTDDTLRRQRGRRDYNFSSWADHREFMDSVMAGAYAKMREYGREADPHGVFGNTGGQGPNAYGGWDFSKIAQSVDLHVPYNISQNDDMLRSFEPRVLKLAPYFGNDRRLVRRMWYQLFHGDCGQIHWDNDEPTGRFLVQPGRTLSPRAKALAPTLRELTRGIGKQVMGMSRAGEEIALHHSQSSVRAHWMMGTLPQGESWIDRGADDCEAVETDVSIHLRDSAVKLIGDCGLQYRFADRSAVEAGELQQCGFKVLLLTHALSLSLAECENIRQFAENGGLVVADALPGVFDEFCRLRPKGGLDDFFGVRRKRFDYAKSGARLQVAGRGGELNLARRSLSLRVCEPTLQSVASARALGRAGTADCLVFRRVGRGAALYLNADLKAYYRQRYRVGSREERDTQELLTAVVRLGDVDRKIHLWARGKKRYVPGIEITRFVQGPVELVCAVVNELRRTSGVGEEASVSLKSFDRPSAMEVEVHQKCHLYNARSGRHFGWTDRFADAFDPFSANVYALLPYRVDGLSAKPLASLKTGLRGQVEIRLQANKGPAGRHVVRCDLFDPKGVWCSYYSKNVVTDGGRGVLPLPFAENDPPGQWRMDLRDAVSGRRETVLLRVSRA